MLVRTATPHANHRHGEPDSVRRRGTHRLCRDALAPTQCWSRSSHRWTYQAGPKGNGLLRYPLQAISMGDLNVRAIVRTYCENSSLLECDTVDQWKPGRLRRGLDGAFDLMADESRP